MALFSPDDVQTSIYPHDHMRVAAPLGPRLTSFSLLQLERRDTESQRPFKHGERSRFVPLEGHPEESVHTATRSVFLYFILSFISAVGVSGASSAEESLAAVSILSRVMGSERGDGLLRSDQTPI